MKSREEIPQWIWYNGQLMFMFDEALRINPEMSIGTFMKKFLSQHDMLEEGFYHTKNQGTIMMLLYGLLVLPKEIWEKKETLFPFESRSKFHVVSEHAGEIETLDFLRYMRNAVSHSHFKINVESSIFTFWNESKGIMNFEVEIHYSDIGKFIEEVGKYYINDVRVSKNQTP
jgi:hypothetical protein